MILHSNFQKFSLGYTPTPKAEEGITAIMPSITFCNLNLQLQGVCTSKYKSSRHKTYSLSGGMQYFNCVGNAPKVTYERLRFENFSGGYTPGPPLKREGRT
jgi:hypothetical protein